MVKVVDCSTLFGNHEKKIVLPRTRQWLCSSIAGYYSVVVMLLPSHLMVPMVKVVDCSTLFGNHEQNLSPAHSTGTVVFVDCWILFGSRGQNLSLVHSTVVVETQIIHRCFRLGTESFCHATDGGCDNLSFLSAGVHVIIELCNY